jgi:uncharacterized membrane protein HdeD (DUF308 family)
VDNEKRGLEPFYRRSPVAFGVLLGCGILVLGIILMSSIPAADPFLSQNLGWVRFAAYTGAIFLLLISSMSKNSRSPAFWGVLSVLFALHTACFLALFHYYRQFTGLEYSIGCVFEYLLLAYALRRGISLLAKRPHHEGA